MDANSRSQIWHRVALDNTSTSIMLLSACMVMAGIYPVGVKMAATWAKGDTGVLFGLLVGALCLGSAVPHFFSALNGLDWRATRPPLAA